ncbi:MAG: Vgb family protein [Acidimicrobiales bacterium]
MGRRRQALARGSLLAILLVALSGCGGGTASNGDKADEPAPQLRPAPEPGQAPVPTNLPAGEVIQLGDGGPEGMVADPVTGMVAVALRQPNRLALVDGRAGQLVTTVPMPGAARHLQLAAPGGPVLVPGEDTDIVARVALPGGEVVGQVQVGRQPHDAAAVGDRLFVADELGGTTSVVENDKVVRAFPEPVQPGNVAVAGGRVGVVDVRGANLYVYDLAGTQSLPPVAAGDGPTHAAADGQGRLVVTDTRGSAVLLFRLDPPTLVERVPLPGAPYGLAVDATRDMLWVALSATNQLVGFRLSEGPPEKMATFDTVRQPNSVAVDVETGRVFVASATDGTLQIIDP